MAYGDAEYVDSTNLLGDGQALQKRADEDGFLYFRELLPPHAVELVRRDLLSVVDSLGWLAEDEGPLTGSLNMEALSRFPSSELRTDIGVTQSCYDEAQKLESVHAIPHHPALLKLYETLFDEEVLVVHPRHIIRMVTAHPALVPTPIHQDFPLVQGAARTWTCWFPLGNCSRENGGLSVLRGSHRLGYVPIKQAQGAGGIEAQLCPWEKDWVTGDFEAGDVLTFPSYTIHRALPSRTPNKIRLSMDVRYQRISDPIEAKSLLPHCDLNWEEIYAGWQKDDLKYYWKNLPLNLSPWDDTLMRPGRRIC